MTSSTPIIGTKVGRARRSLRQLWQVPAFVVGLLALLGAAVSAPWRHSPKWWEYQEVLSTLRQGVDKGLDGDSLVALAENARVRQPDFPERDAEAHFLIGSAYYRQAQGKPAAFAKVIWPEAVEHLEQALTLEVAKNDRAPAQYRLGYSLYQLGKDVPRALEQMAAAVDKGADQPLQGYLLLVQANLKLTPPNLDGALAASRRILDLTPESNAEGLAQARLMQGDLLLRKGMRSEAIKELTLIGPEVAREVRVKARLLEVQCCEEEGQWPRAVQLWQELLKDDKLVEGGKARIFYFMGWCYHRMEPHKLADNIKVWTESLNQGGAAGQAAGLRLGEMRLSLGDKQAQQALDHWKQAMKDVNSPDEFHNSYIELEQVKELFDTALKHFQETQDTQKAQEVAELFRKIAPGEDRLAQALEAAALQMQKKKDVPAEVLAQQFQRAGEAYENAAKARNEAQRPEVLWHAIQCFLAAKDTARSLDLLNQYVKMETREARLAEAWFTLGRLYHGQDKKDFAHAAHVKCLEYPNTPFAHRSRYYLAMEEIEKKNYERAKTILDDILLSGTNSESDRASQEKSQYAMASLLMKMKNYPVAKVHLAECIRLYPENPNVILAREQLGECHRCLAKKELANEEGLLKQLAGATEEHRHKVEETMRHYRMLRVMALDEAIKTYQGLAEDLRERAREQSLTKIEQILLRRAMFGMAESHLDKGESAEGLRIFQKLQEEHRRTVEGFYAGLRICNYAEVGAGPRLQAKASQEMAVKSLRLLMEDLKSMKNDDEVFRSPDVTSRTAWLKWAETMEKKLAAPTGGDRPMSSFP